MAGDSFEFTPTKWAQRRPHLFVTFCVEDCKNTSVTFESNKIIFQGQGGTGSKKYHSELELFKEIVPENCRWVQTEREILCTVAKKETDEDYWPRLLSAKLKQHWLKVDFAKWNDEDDSSADEADPAAGGQPDLSEMMAQMGRGGAGDMEMPDESDSDDSDDEELPGLEDAPVEGAAEEEKPEPTPVENGQAEKTLEAQACDA